jgi:hypothetical protein
MNDKRFSQSDSLDASLSNCKLGIRFNPNFTLENLIHRVSNTKAFKPFNVKNIVQN